MRISVYGAGNTGIALCVHLLSKGYEVLLYTRDVNKRDYFNNNSITATGALQGEFNIKSTNSVEQLLEFSQTVIVSTLANNHEEVFDNIYKRKNEDIIILNGNWGGYQAFKIRERIYGNEGGEIIEAGGMPYVAVYKAGIVNIKAIKSNIDIASVDKQISSDIKSLFQDLYEHVTIKKNVIETSIAAPNPIIHVPLALFNICRIEHGDDFNLLVDGFSKRAEDYITNIDLERKAIAEKLGVEYKEILPLLNGYWDYDYHSLSELYSQSTVYQKVKAPVKIDHRFITEDMPFGIVPIHMLGKLLNIDTPYTNALILIFSLYYKELNCEDMIQFDIETLKAIL